MCWRFRIGARAISSSRLRAFAIAHSITLTLAAFAIGPIGAVGGWFVPTIGGLIALSLVYVSIENGVGRGFRSDAGENPSRPRFLRHRWIVALVFGLFHGLGFAIALQDTLQFAGSHPIAALLAYNVGLELGTLIILAIVLPAANLLFTNVVSERAGIIVSSIIIGHVGWHWMTERLAIAQLSQLAGDGSEPAPHCRPLAACADGGRRNGVVPGRTDAQEAIWADPDCRKNPSSTVGSRSGSW